MENQGYIVVIVLLSIVASFSVTALRQALKRIEETEERLVELDERVSVLQTELLAHTHSEHKATPTIPQSFPIVRYTWEKRRRMRWQ